MTQTVQPIIFVSTGRTGTKFFAQILAELFPQAEAYHDTPYSTLINILTNMHLAGWLPKSAVVAVWQRLKGQELRDCSQPFFIDSNNHLYGLVMMAPELYPDLKVVHIVRDPRTYVRSHLNWSRHRPKSYVANYVVPFWQPHPWLMGQMSWRRWLSLSPFEQFCWVWDFKNRYNATLAGTSIPYLRVRFEDFFGGPEPETHFNQLLQFMGLPQVDGLHERFQEPVNVTATRSFPKWPAWTPAQCALLDSFCQPQMGHYGYGLEPAWQEMVHQGQSDIIFRSKQNL